MNNKNAVVIVAVNKPAMLEISKPLWEKYAHKVGADLIVIDQPVFNLAGQDDYNYAIFEKFQVFDVLCDYARVLRVDVDTIVLPRAGNVFGLVPETHVGMVFEDVGSRRAVRRGEIIRANRVLGDLAYWQSGYGNSGVVVASRQHASAFLLSHEISIIDQLGPMKEQTLLNWQLRALGHPTYSMPWSYNHMTMFSEAWNRSADPLLSCIIHVAGKQRGKLARMRNLAQRAHAQWQ